MKIENTGAVRGNGVSSETTDSHTRRHRFSIDTFVGTGALYLGDDGYPLQLSLVMVGEDSRYGWFTKIVAETFTFLFLKRVPIEDMYHYFAPLRSLEDPKKPPVPDSTYDAILNEVFCWLFREFMLPPQSAPADNSVHAKNGQPPRNI